MGPSYTNNQKGTYNSSMGAYNNLQAPTTAQGAAATSAYEGLGPAGIESILAPATGAATNIYNTGGYQQPQLGTLENQETSNLGGLDPTALAKLSGQYQDLISSGGISDATQAAMQRQATSGVGSIYGILSQQQERNKAVTGGEGGGGETAEMARQLSQQESNAITGVNAEVGQLRQQGTEAGLAGASNLASSQAAAQNAAANIFGSTLGGVAGGSQYGASLLSGLGGTTVSGALGSAAGLGNLYATGLGAEQGFLGNAAGVANKPANPGLFGQILGSVGPIAGGVGGLLKGIGSLP